MGGIIAQINRFYNMSSSFVAVDKIFIGVLLIFVALASFSLGRLSKIFDERPEFSFQDLAIDPQIQNPPQPFFLKEGGVPISNKNIVASKGGKKYYFIWCKGVENLKEKNKVYFSSEDDAKRAGKTLANNCK